MERVNISVPLGSVVITPDDAITGSGALLLVASPWFEFGGRGYFVIPADETNPIDLMISIACAMAERVKDDETKTTT